MTIDDYLAQRYTGQWFTYSDPTNKSFETLELTEYGKEQGYELPTKEDFEAWQKEQQKKQKEQEIINKRRKEYGTAEDQLEFIAENGVKAFQDKVKEIKEKYPK